MQPRTGDVFAGDEFCNTQFGNNNSYCQDNITSWLDWNRLEEYKEIHDFFRYMIRLRKDNAILRKTTKPAACKLPEIRFTMVSHGMAVQIITAG